MQKSGQPSEGQAALHQSLEIHTQILLYLNRVANQRLYRIVNELLNLAKIGASNLDLPIIVLARR